jgi:RND family efflux transporter MFP subunit
MPIIIVKGIKMKFFYYILMGFVVFFASSNVYADEQTMELTIIPVKALSTPSAQLLVGGTVIAHKSVVLTAQLPGRIISISGEEGDQFKKGDLLVKINDDELLAKRQTAVAQYMSAMSAVHNARVQFSRQIISPSTSNKAPGGMGMPGMFDQMFTNPMADMMGTRDYGFERRADITATRSRLDQAHHALEQARAQIQQIDTKLRDTQSIAPYSGTIVKKAIEIGDTVQPGQSLLTYEDLNTLQIIVDVPSRLIQNLHQDQLLQAKIDGAKNIINVRVIKIFPTSDPIRHTTRVKFALPRNRFITPGNYAEVKIPAANASTQQHLFVPATAVIKRGGLPSVFVLNENNRIELHLVRVGDIFPSGDIEILYGVKEGQKILDKPAPYITSGFQLKNQKGI